MYGEPKLPSVTNRLGYKVQWCGYCVCYAAGCVELKVGYLRCSVLRKW